MLTDLAYIRGQKGLAQRDLAKLADVSKSTIANIEKGLVIPRGDTICRLARALEEEPERLFYLLFHDEEYWGGGGST